MSNVRVVDDTYTYTTEAVSTDLTLVEEVHTENRECTRHPENEKSTEQTNLSYGIENKASVTLRIAVGSLLFIARYAWNTCGVQVFSKSRNFIKRERNDRQQTTRNVSATSTRDKIIASRKERRISMAAG